MEQQSISIAKAGITCTLPSRTTILAAANPAGGHYDMAKTVAENLKISAPMLSRFDLIFILVDNSDEVGPIFDGRCAKLRHIIRWTKYPLENVHSFGLNIEAKMKDRISLLSNQFFPSSYFISIQIYEC